MAKNQTVSGSLRSTDLGARRHRGLSSAGFALKQTPALERAVPLMTALRASEALRPAPGNIAGSHPSSIPYLCMISLKLMPR